MPVSMSGSWNISGNVAMDPVTAFVAVAGATTAVNSLQNQPILNFNVFSNVTGGYLPYTYYVSSGILPPGLTLNSTTGLISGTPTTVQNTAPVVFGVQDSFGNQSGTLVTINFQVQQPLGAFVASTAPVLAYQNTAITSVTPLVAFNGFQPYTYSITSGTLPTGVTLNSSTGAITGTPTGTQSASPVTISVKDSQNNQASTTATVSFTVNAALLATAGATTTVPGYQNTAITSFNPFSSVTGGYTPYVYSISSGTLPAGVTINSSTGLVSGTPTTLQLASSVTFTVTDNQGTQASTTVTVSFTVNNALVAIAGATNSVSASQNTAITSFNPFSSVTGGYTPYVYSVSSGTLPTGITINSSTGLVSGTPSATYATASVIFKVTDAQGTIASTTKTVGFTVNAPISAVAGATTTVSGAIGTAITSFNPFNSVSNGTTPYTYYVSAGTLPQGITIDPNIGTVSGTPTTIIQGGSIVTFSVRDLNNVTASTTSTVTFTVGYTIQYLIVGGGGYGTYGGGGGGGYVSGNIIAVPSTPYPLTVGGGSGTPGVNGSNSVAFSITAFGGGWGGRCGNPTPGAANPGGSGGGGFRSLPGFVSQAGGSGTNYPGPTQQGFPGGTGMGGNLGQAGGGGGGAGGAGTNGTMPAACKGFGGTGGLGKIWPYTGPTVFYGAGGGGGGGGTGGGGTGPSSPSLYGTGGGFNSVGERGAIILAVPTPYYPGSAPGATVTTPPAAPGMTVLTYTTSTPTSPATFTYTA
jgi:hypothetical protein